jgi:hypothetical protein
MVAADIEQRIKPPLHWGKIAPRAAVPFTKHWKKEDSAFETDRRPTLRRPDKAARRLLEHTALSTGADCGAASLSVFSPPDA